MRRAKAETLGAMVCTRTVPASHVHSPPQSFNMEAPLASLSLTHVHYVGSTRELSGTLLMPCA